MIPLLRSVLGYRGSSRERRPVDGGTWDLAREFVSRR